MFDVTVVNIGDFVKFNAEECKKRKYLKWNKECGVPECLVGLTVNGKEVDKDTEFLVLDLIYGEWGCRQGVHLQTDFGQLYFDYVLVEWSSF